MKDSNINIIVKYLAKEDLSPEEMDLVLSLKQSNDQEFKEIEAIYHSQIFSNMNFDASVAYRKVMEQLEKAEKRTNIRPLYGKAWLQIAAGILILVSIGIFAAGQYHWEVKQSNTTAALEEVSLPDGSEIILDKNASISYQRTIFSAFGREISMSGRAHFHITKDPQHPFTVHSSVVDVTVLGTQFTINEINARTQIVLDEGMIRLSGNESANGIVLDKPGMQILLTETSIIKEDQVSPELYASWKDERLSFNHCSVREVIQFLEDTYGVQAIIENPDDLNAKLFGSAPSDDPYLIINAIGEILNTQIKSKSKTK
jgi:ferric-dicitrate binding protein FerR (iron transport regulator)